MCEGGHNGHGGVGVLQSTRQFPPEANHLLAAFPAVSFARLLGSMTLVPMRSGEVLHESWTEIRHVYLPGTGSTVRRAVVQVAGYAFQVRAGAFLAEFDKGGAVQQVLLRYVQALMTQMSQAAVCNRYHTVEQRLCRWLLQTLDRVPVSELHVTQEAIGNMLGVRRSGVARAVGNLQDAGIIEYRRGLVAVSDRTKLEADACECYAVVKKETDRLLRFPFADETARGQRE